MRIEALANKKVLLLGFGIEGKATLEFLKHHFPDAEVGIADQKDGPNYLEKQNVYDLAIRTPGLPKRLITIPYTTATNIFFANVNGTTIGVTGSKGKSTTAALIHAIFKAAALNSRLVGNIGKPMLEELLSVNDRISEVPGTSDIQKLGAVYVCELSSYQLDDVEYSPHISVFLNFFPDHMDYHGSVAEYWEAKKRIVARATPNDYFVYNPAYPQLAQLARETKAMAIPFVKTLPFPDTAIPLLGEHNKDNVRAAVAVAEILKITPEAIERAVRNFKPLPHRLQCLGTFHGVTFYDDAISTTPESTIKAIEALPNISAIFLGGQNRGYDFSALAETLVKYKIPNLVLFPDSGAAIAEALRKAGTVPARVLETRDMARAVEFAYAHSPAGTVCLLSTASPSYTLWKNFEEKGDLFQQLVKRLAPRENHAQTG